MHPAFNLYGKSPSVEMQKEALKAQGKYQLTDAQMCCLLEIHDFIRRLSAFDHSPYDLEIVERYKGEPVNRQYIPTKTAQFISGAYSKCSEASKHFCNIRRHLSFERFAAKILAQRPFKGSDFLPTVNGVIEVKQRAYKKPAQVEFEDDAA